MKLHLTVEIHTKETLTKVVNIFLILLLKKKLKIL